MAEKNFLPIIGDEIYGEMVFKGQQFHSIASLSNNVPVLSCGGIGKKYLVPGWRVGWILIHDKNEILKKEVCVHVYVYVCPCVVCVPHVFVLAWNSKSFLTIFYKYYAYSWMI